MQPIPFSMSCLFVFLSLSLSAALFNHQQYLFVQDNQTCLEPAMCAPKHHHLYFLTPGQGGISTLTYASSFISFWMSTTEEENFCIFSPQLLRVVMPVQPASVTFYDPLCQKRLRTYYCDIKQKRKLQIYNALFTHTHLRIYMLSHQVFVVFFLFFFIINLERLNFFN